MSTKKLLIKGWLAVATVWVLLFTIPWLFNAASTLLNLLGVLIIVTILMIAWKVLGSSTNKE